jgi:hypothetical protein
MMDGETREKQKKGSNEIQPAIEIELRTKDVNNDQKQ